MDEAVEEELMTLVSCPQCPTGKVALLAVFPLPLSSSVSKQIHFYFQQMNIFSKFLAVSLYFHCCFKHSSTTVN
jgi:hypothetical protein